jgi:predicted nucleic acid-binding protein
VKGAVLPQIFNLRAGLNTSQWDTRQRILTVLQGNARPETHAADASHLAEAVETGCAFFIARDKRFFKKRDELREVLPPSLNIVTLEEFFEIFDDYEARRPR